ncbi:MAG: esterase [Bacteroidetes bacterium]|nr:esterase [Bacteroidota bacterium]
MNTSDNTDNLRLSKEALQYLVKTPNITTEKTPLIILLHGVGSNEQDLFSFANQIPDHFLIISARAPHTIGQGSYAWFQVNFSSQKRIINYEQAEESRKLIIQFIGQLKERYSFDEKQVYLIGFSQGGIMSYSVGLTRPDLVKGIAVMSGRLLEEVKPLITINENLTALKIFISHGINDNVLNIQYARDSFSYLKTMNNNLVYKEYIEGHTINNEMRFDLINWLA